MKSYLANNKVTPLNCFVLFCFLNFTFYETFALPRWTWNSIKKNFQQHFIVKVTIITKNNMFCKTLNWKFLCNNNIFYFWDVFVPSVSSSSTDRKVTNRLSAVWSDGVFKFNVILFKKPVHSALSARWRTVACISAALVISSLAPPTIFMFICQVRCVSKRSELSRQTCNFLLR